METSGLKTLTTPLYFCSRASSVLRPSFLPHVKKKFQEQFQLSLTHSSRFSPLCSLSEKLNGNSLSNGFGEAAVSNAPQDKLLQVVLVSPQIPGNTGSIARSCAASGVGLHLIEPLGFDVDDTKLKRAGLDYWPYVVVKVHSSWADFRDYFRKQSGDKRLLAFTKRGTNIHSDYAYRRGDWLVFGSETNGLPPEALFDCKSESLGGVCLGPSNTSWFYRLSGFGTYRHLMNHTFSSITYNGNLTPFRVNNTVAEGETCQSTDKYIYSK